MSIRTKLLGAAVASTLVFSSTAHATAAQPPATGGAQLQQSGLAGGGFAGLSLVEILAILAALAVAIAIIADGDDDESPASP